MVHAQPAPPTQALNEGSTRTNRSTEEAAQLQRTWDLAQAPKQAPMYCGTKSQNRTGQEGEEVRRMRQATWTDADSPEATRVWHTIMPCVRAQIKFWDTEVHTIDLDVPRAMLRSFLRSSAQSDALVDNPLQQLIMSRRTGNDPLSFTFMPGDFVIALALAGTEVQVDTATHSSRVFLPSDKWVLIGINCSERARIAGLGVGEDWALTLHGPRPSAMWTCSDGKLTTDGARHRERSYRTAHEEQHQRPHSRVGETVINDPASSRPPEAPACPVSNNPLNGTEGGPG